MKRLLAILPVAAFFAACADQPAPSKRPDPPPASGPNKVAAVDPGKDKDKKDKGTDEFVAVDDKEFKHTGTPQFLAQHIERRWGLSSSLQFNGVSKRTVDGMDEFRIVFTFAKNLTAKDITEIKQVIKPGERDVLLSWVCFDKDMVSLAKFNTTRVEGDISGVMGDAFRVYVRIDQNTLKKTAKVEARFQGDFADRERDKDKDKDKKDSIIRDKDKDKDKDKKR
jgi:hypothetical protein